ncbi:MAG: response regulator transcription factor [Undibacterium sp.]|nr:response regulator transcription factor [Undibacterium sp.]
MKKTILIIEDHPVYRDALYGLLSLLIADTKIVAVYSIEEAIVMASHIEHVNLILVDLGLPGINGVDAIKYLKEKWPKTEIVVITASDDRREINLALRAGARIIISKSIPSKKIIQVIEKVLRKETLEDNWITDRTTNLSPARCTINLTPRQQETLVLLCKGLPNKEIALRLQVTERTVKMHISSIFLYFGVGNRVHATLAARKLGLDTASVSAQAIIN